MSKLQKKMAWVVVAFVLASCLSYLFTIATGDIYVLIAGSKQADYLGGNALVNVINQWDLKGALLREYMYILYWFAGLFGTYGTAHFLDLVKLGSLILIVGLCMLSAKNLCTDRWSRILIGSLSIIGVCMTFPSSHVQAEPMCALLCLLALSFIVSAERAEGRAKKNTLLVIAGFIIGQLFFFKSVLILLAVSVVAAWFLLEKLSINKGTTLQVSVVAASSVVTIIAGLLVLWKINPNEISNMFYASIYQNTLIKTGVTLHSLANAVYKLVGMYVKGAMHLYPVLFVGVLCALYNTIRQFRENGASGVVYRIIMWLMPALFIMLSNCYFQYHYMTFVFPALVEIIMFVKKFELGCDAAKGHRNVAVWLSLFCVVNAGTYVLGRLMPNLLYHSVYWVVILLFAIVSVLLCAASAVWDRFYAWIPLSLLFSSLIFLNYLSAVSDFSLQSREIRRQAEIMNSGIELDSTATCMYLDDGSGAWSIGLESELPAYYPLPLQRISNDSEYADLDVRLEQMNRAMNYTGKYVCTQNAWFFRDGMNKEIYEKIQREYEKTDEIAVYSLPWDIFSRPSHDSISFLDLYTRKEYR